MVLCKDQQNQQTAKMTRKKKTQITNVKNERGNMSTNLIEIKKVL